VSPASDNHIAMIVREPVGVVGLVLPWNFPLLMLAWKIGPALAAGCSVIVKPAEETSLTALRVAELAMEVGIPAGVLNVVPGTGPEVGELLGRHMDVEMVSFTGATETGRRFLRYAAESNLKDFTLEMGGKNPAVVLDDAESLDRVAAHIVNGAFWNMGENCSASSRLIVQKGIKDALLKRIFAHAREWPMENLLDPVNRVGALVSSEHFKKVCGYLGKGVKVLMGGKAKDGFVEPTIIEITDRNAKQAREEIFGPILSVLTVENFDEAIALANDTEYGLAASIFTSNVKKAIRGGRDNGIHAHDQYTHIKTIRIDLADDRDRSVA
jgi:gamma-glutamyl-gamma-aminobutyraldehyde dehydrogenase